MNKPLPPPTAHDPRPTDLLRQRRERQHGADLPGGRHALGRPGELHDVAHLGQGHGLHAARRQGLERPGLERGVGCAAAGDGHDAHGRHGRRHGGGEGGGLLGGDDDGRGRGGRLGDGDRRGHRLRLRGHGLLHDDGGRRHHLLLLLLLGGGRGGRRLLKGGVERRLGRLGGGGVGLPEDADGGAAAGRAEDAGGGAGDGHVGAVERRHGGFGWGLAGWLGWSVCVCRFEGVVGA